MEETIRSFIRLLLDEGITPKGKPFEHSQMEKDHYDAFQYIVKEAKNRARPTPDLIRKTAAKVMHGTGREYNVPAGTFDSSRGEYRKIGVFTGETSYPSFLKVEGMVAAIFPFILLPMATALKMIG